MEQSIAFLTNTILTAANVSIHITSQSTRRKSVPWWTPSVAQAIATRKRSFRYYLLYRADGHKFTRNRERARCQKKYTLGGETLILAMVSYEIKLHYTSE